MIIGNNIVHENDISWSKRILGKEALTQINIKTIIHDFIPVIIPYHPPSTNGYKKLFEISLVKK